MSEKLDNHFLTSVNSQMGAKVSSGSVRSGVTGHKFKPSVPGLEPVSRLPAAETAKEQRQEKHDDQHEKHPSAQKVSLQQSAGLEDARKDK